MPNPVTLEEAFWSKVDRKSPIECWMWTGSLSGPMQYGHLGLTIAGKCRFFMAHRLAWGLHHVGPLPHRAQIIHLCDQPRCVNPMHLKEADHHENMRDRQWKGRTYCGPRPRLSRKERDRLRDLHATGLTHVAIAHATGYRLDRVNKLLGRLTFREDC